MKVWATEEMIELAQQGYSARDIKESLHLACGVRHVQRLIKPYRPERLKAPTRHPGDALGPIHDILTQLMEQKGLNPKVCGLCGLPQFKKCDIHHTKYEGATLDDLMFVCRKCNTAPRNVGLL